MNLNIFRHKSKTKLLRTKEQKQTISVVLLAAKLIQSPEFERYLEPISFVMNFSFTWFQLHFLT